MKQILFLVLILVASSTCQQSNDTRCSIYDDACQANFFQVIARQYAYTGIPAAGVPIIDPRKLFNYTLSIMGLLKLTLIEGEATGIGKCIVSKFESNVEAQYRQPEFICDKIIIQGRYKLEAAPILGRICGWCNIHGEGNGTIILEDWFFKIRYPFCFQRQDDGKIYMNALFDKAVYESTVKKVTVRADCIKRGKHDITNDVICFINNNWKLLMDSYIGKYINDESAEDYYRIYKIFYQKSPANTFLKDDLTKLLDKSCKPN